MKKDTSLKKKKVKDTGVEENVPVKENKVAKEPAKKKKSSVRFAENVEDKKEKKVVEEPKKKHVPEMVKEVEGAPEPIKGKKRLRNRKKTGSQKRMKLAEEIMAPSVEKVEFTPEQKKFSDFAIDERIQKMIGQMGWSHPTQVQESVIALALEDKNIMARARTGSGKTAAFLIPTINRIVNFVNSSPSAVGPFALFVGPTKELVTQINNLINKFLEPLPFLSCLNLSELSAEEKAVWEMDNPSFVVSTPGKIVEMLKMRPEFCKNVKTLVLDEADLLLSFGYEEEMSYLRERLPDQYQCIFTSATLTDDMTLLKKIFMTGPVVTIKLKEGDLPDADQLSQYLITCLDEEQRFSIMISMIKLRLIVGKTIIFVNDTDRCYKLSLVLRAFGVKACVLNSEMPANSRCHVINQFNNGYYSIIIASDAQDAFADGGETTPKTKGPRDKESGIARGIDFHHVSNVINFDFPTNTDTYIHRVGRTARGWNKGTALSFCSPEERPTLEAVQEEINTLMNRTVLKPYEIRINELDSFVLRTREALMKCSKSNIKYARLREIKLELMRSQKLQSYFVSNPREKDLMSTTEQPATLKVNEAISDVPDYIVPKALRGTNYNLGKKKTSKPGLRNRSKKKFMSFNQKKHKRQQADPLRSFKA